MTAPITVSVEDGLAHVVLENPPVNILTRAILAQLRSVLATVESQPDVRVVLLTANGKHFSAGADVGEHLPPECDVMIPEFLETIQALVDFPLPVVAGVNGRCLGGGFELVQAADVIIAGEGAVFGQPEIMLGVIPPAACVLLPQRCSWGVAAELVLSGDSIDAYEAERVGLVRRVVPDGDVASAARDLARRLARHSGAALRHGKRALRTMSSRSDDMNAVGELYLKELMQSHDAVEGLRAFVEKREPAWSHR